MQIEKRIHVPFTCPHIKKDGYQSFYANNKERFVSPILSYHNIRIVLNKYSTVHRSPCLLHMLVPCTVVIYTRGCRTGTSALSRNQDGGAQ